MKMGDIYMCRCPLRFRKGGEKEGKDEQLLSVFGKHTLLEDMASRSVPTTTQEWILSDSQS